MTDTEAKAQLRAADAREINYPDVVGWEWTGKPWTETGTCILTAENMATEDDCMTHDHEDNGISHPGLEHSLVWDRHNGTFMYSIKRESDGRWVHTKCRGDFWEDADTLKKARAIAAEFVKIGEDS